LRLFPEVPAAWRDDALAARWEEVRALRRVVTGALEVARADKRIGSGLQAHPVLHAAADRLAVLDGVDVAEIAITSDVTLVEGPPPAGAFTLPELPDVGVRIDLAEGEKCERCWRVLPEVGGRPDWPDLCQRCADAVAAQGAAAAAAT
jgi:isoleucyl-tRNA synthetase